MFYLVIIFKLIQLPGGRVTQPQRVVGRHTQGEVAGGCGDDDDDDEMTN